MTAKNQYLLIAREVSTDANDKMNSIIKIIEKFGFTIDLEKFQLERQAAGGKHLALPIKYTIATSWIFSEKLKKETFFNFRIKIMDPEGESLGGPDQENLLPADVNRINMNFTMDGLPVTKAGVYTLRAELLSKGGEVLAKETYPFEVELTDDSRARQ